MLRISPLFANEVGGDRTGQYKSRVAESGSRRTVEGPMDTQQFDLCAKDGS